ncbi:hypothetical protein [Burkholderia sp. F1]|uniref:hypothetical protein n=1 Tax=Burkholderia sp. F1 TaxID=3366817 RepID=UPI003D75D265
MKIMNCENCSNSDHYIFLRKFGTAAIIDYHSAALELLDIGISCAYLMRARSLEEIVSEQARLLREVRVLHEIAKRGVESGIASPPKDHNSRIGMGASAVSVQLRFPPPSAAGSADSGRMSDQHTRPALVRFGVRAL